MKHAIGSVAALATGLLGTAAYWAHSSAGEAAISVVPAAQAATATTAAATSCESLAGLRLKDVEIVTATAQIADTPVEGARMPSMPGMQGALISGLPAFCRVIGRIHPEAGSDIGFEVWLPAAGWDGRLHGVGIGGFAGSIDHMTLSTAVKAGQAAVATDTGHTGAPIESSWAKGRPERVRDYGWRAIHLSTVAAKDLIRAFYKRGPDKSYFVGCSGGGRQGLMEAARFPEDYDGILSSAPAASFTELGLAMINAIQAQLPAGAAIRPDQTGLLQEEVVKQCDAIDGQVDGLIDDPRQCRFDAAKLQCGTSQSAQCFSPQQVTALKRIHDGPRDAAGRLLAAGYLPSGSEAGKPLPMMGWEGYLLSNAGGVPQAESLAGGMLKDVIQQPFATTANFDFNRDTPRFRAEMARDIDASPNLQRFFARGGKLILWHGWADPAIPPEATLRYHTAMLRQSGPKAASSSRLFMVPGVQHCFGGIGADDLGQNGAPAPGSTRETNMVAALQDWTEGRAPAPETFVGRRDQVAIMAMMGMPVPKVVRERLVCAWPKRAVLKPGGGPDKASSYRCI